MNLPLDPSDIPQTCSFCTTWGAGPPVRPRGTAQPWLTRLLTALIGVLVFCSWAISDWGRTAHAETIPHIKGLQPVQWRLIWKSDSATRATLSWNTGEAGRLHRVHLLRDGSADSPSNGSDGAPAGIPGADASEQPGWQIVACQRNGPFTGSDDEVDRKRMLYYHHARLTDLEPNSRYRVVLESDGHRSPEMVFITAPREDRGVSILYGGDSRSGHAERKAINRLMARLTAEQSISGRPRILALAHGGDYVRDGRVLGQWSRWMTDHELTVGADGRLLPIIAARGNHDRGAPFNEIFDFPVEDKNYYVTNIGPQMRIITLNTETTTSGTQAAWLEQQLAQTRPSHRWLLAQYHRPAYPAVKVPSGAMNWVPLFEKYNLDLACEADGHCIKRTAPIRNNQIDQSGVVYIGEGGLGVGQRTPKADRWYLRAPHGKVGSGHHVHLITATSQGLTCRVVLLGGSVFDKATWQPRGEAETTALFGE